MTQTHCCCTLQVRRLDQWSGQYSYAGVHGSVQVLLVPKHHIEDVQVVTELSVNGSASLRVKVRSNSYY